MQEEIEKRIALVQHIFREVSEEPIEDKLTDLVHRLLKYQGEFESLAYEASSYKIALNSFSSDFLKWNDFKNNFAKKHHVQVYIGLGIALGRVGQGIDSISVEIASSDYRYIADGVGFYYGLFKKRFAIDTQQKPDGLQEALPFFDEGLGRSLWYTNKGDLDIISQIISCFAEERKPLLWKGIGIAFTYAGGFDNSTIEKLKKCSGTFFNNVNEGMLAVTKTRSTAGTLNKYSLLIAEKVFKNSLKELR